jgi:para-aminobenzoate synthetase component I
VTRRFERFPITDFIDFKTQMLNWSNTFSICAFLDSNQYKDKHQHFKCLAGVGSIAHVSGGVNNAFTELAHFAEQQHDWLFGHLSFELHGFAQRFGDPIGFPLIHFFVPQIVLMLHDHFVEIGALAIEPQLVFKQISGFVTPVKMETEVTTFDAKFSREEYLSTVEKLQQHIRRGDCYEINFCQEFFARDCSIDPVSVFNELLNVSPNPFAAFYKMEERYLLCASPERYLQVKDRQVLSQPIKGTLQRVAGANEQQAVNALYKSEKDRSENVMVVDMVRNDLSRVCLPGSVHVDELFGIYSFPQLYQMISTISGTLRDGLNWIDAIEATFPMGSMTGAPKHSVIELITRYERSMRGLFSGAVGYVTPNGDADFNVVIRSLQYNGDDHYLSYQVGSGITHYSEPEAEYQECLVKASAIKKVLGLPAP